MSIEIYKEKWLQPQYQFPSHLILITFFISIVGCRAKSVRFRTTFHDVNQILSFSESKSQPKYVNDKGLHTDYYCTRNNMFLPQ